MISADRLNTVHKKHANMWHLWPFILALLIFHLSFRLFPFSWIQTLDYLLKAQPNLPKPFHEIEKDICMRCIINDLLLWFEFSLIFIRFMLVFVLWLLSGNGRTEGHVIFLHLSKTSRGKLALPFYSLSCFDVSLYFFFACLSRQFNSFLILLLGFLTSNKLAPYPVCPSETWASHQGWSVCIQTWFSF